MNLVSQMNILRLKSVVWCPGTGNVGFNALGKVFSGEVNPSGKTPDTFIYDMTTAPWWNNAEKTEYTNLADLAVEGMNAGMRRCMLRHLPIMWKVFM